LSLIILFIFSKKFKFGSINLQLSIKLVIWLLKPLIIFNHYRKKGNQCFLQKHVWRLFKEALELNSRYQR